MKIKYIILILVTFISIRFYAQDVEQKLKELKELKNILKEEPLSVTGSIGANTTFYQPYGIQPRRDPFFWSVNANLTFSILNKVTIPFTAVITQQDKNFTNGLDKFKGKYNYRQFSQAFNQFGISPKYKWLTLHAGYRSVQFSEYTLSGTMFLGGGIEINPEKSLVTGSAVFGRFARAIPTGGVDGIVVSLPAYKRWGGGAKVKVGTNDNYGELIYMKMWDDINSIPFDTALSITPQENQIFSIATKQKITKWLSTSGDFSFSMYTKNLYENIIKIQRFTYVNQLYDARPSSQFNKALNASIDFTPEKFVIGLKYKRIDPDYKTLGSIFLTNDVEEISSNLSFGVMKNKINISTSIGFQRNNLDKIQVVTSKRIIGSLNASYNITEHLNLSANYSNFSSNTIPVRDVFSDSIKFVQLTQSGGLTSNYSFGKQDAKHTLSGTINYQESGGNKQELTTFLNNTLAYNINFSKSGLGISTSILYNKSTNGAVGTNEGIGATIGAQKSVLKNKIRLAVNFGYQNAYLDKELTNNNLTSSFNFNFTIDKHQSIKVDCSYIDKKAVKQGAQNFSEIRGNLGYVCTFGFKTKEYIKNRKEKKLKKTQPPVNIEKTE